MKKYLVLAFLITLIIISGCKKNTDTGNKGTFKGGTEGVSVSFVNLAPPSSFTQGDSVKLKVLLKNKGETLVQTGNAKVRIFGINLDNFGLQNVYKSNLGPIQGQGELTATGGEQEVELGTINYKLPIINQDSYTLRARLCYPYQTLVKADVCSQSLITQESKGEICALAGEKIKSGDVSSAPIQVTSVTEQTRSNDQVRFDIKIENKGKGQVFLIDNKCEDLDKDEVRFESKNKIKITVRGPINVKCAFRSGDPSSSGIITLDDTGISTLSCWKNVEEPIVEKLDLQLDYLYREETSKDILIYQSRR